MSIDDTAENGIVCNLLAEFVGGKKLYRIRSPEYLKNIDRGKYYIANISMFSEDEDIQVVLGVPPLQKSIDYKSDINDLYFIFDESQHQTSSLKSIKSISLVEPFSDEKRLQLQKELIPISSRT